MIKNERQYRITKSEANNFKKVIGELEAAPSEGQGDPLIAKAQIAGLRSQLADLDGQLQEYDELRSGKCRIVETVKLDELPRTLIKARIAAQLSQKQLAVMVGLKEQQLQKYEATEYRGASLSRLVQIASALKLNVKEHAFLPVKAASSPFDIFKRLEALGIDRDFVIKRLLPNQVSQKARSKTDGTDPEIVFHATVAASHIYGLTPDAIVGTNPTFSDTTALTTARFKVSARAEQRRLSAYTFYAHFLALLLLETTRDLPRKPVPSDPTTVRRAVHDQYGELNLSNTLKYVWSLGIPVLPLNDPGAFHGATWRSNGRNIIVLKQTTESLDRWLHDLLHEVYHTSREPDKLERSVIESSEASVERRESEEEFEATSFAADVLLNGRAEELAEACVEATRRPGCQDGSVNLLKRELPRVAEHFGVSVGALANYMAFRLALQNIDWWGTAQNLQAKHEQPWRIVRDELLQRVAVGVLAPMDRDIFMRALTE